MTHPNIDRPALVSHAPRRPDEPVEYLQLGAGARAGWTRDLSGATRFPSMRDAMRAALRLPARLRSYGLPLAAELMTAGEPPIQLH